ncbi:MAG TPA: hypothetical protein VFB15_03555 [Candidatus Binataceae bacterium]|nr:hypothetical protein [Candidatus Binataceae bacterium]
MRRQRKCLPGLTALLLLATAGLALAQTTSSAPVGTSPQVPQPPENGVNWKGVGIGAGTVAGNVLYIPAKLVYGILGGIGGGAGYVLTGGNKQVADTIWRSSLGGDYVLTPDMVAGKQPVHFSGPTATSAAPDGSSNAAASSSTAAAGSASYSAAAQPVTPAPIDSGATAMPSAGGASSATTSRPALSEAPVSPSKGGAPPLSSTAIE